MPSDQERLALAAALRAENRDLRNDVVALQRFIECLGALNDAGRRCSDSVDLPRLLELVLDNAVHACNARHGSLLVPDDATGELEFVRVTGEPKHEELVGRRLPAGDGIAGWVASMHRATIVNNVAADQRFYRGIDRETHYRTQSVLAAPLSAHGRLLGVVEVLDRRDGQLFTTANRRLLELMCRFAGEMLLEAVRGTDRAPAGPPRDPAPAPETGDRLNLEPRSQSSEPAAADTRPEAEAEADADAEDDLGTLRRDNATLRERLRRLRDFIAAFEALLAARDDPSLADWQLMSALGAGLAGGTEAAGARRGSLLVVDDATGELVYVVSCGEAEREHAAWQRAPADVGLVGWVMRHRESAIVNDTRGDTRCKPDDPARRMLVVPVLADGRACGLLELASEQHDAPFDPAHGVLIGLLAPLAASVLKRLEQHGGGEH